MVIARVVHYVSLEFICNLFVINIFFLLISRFSCNRKIWLSASLILYVLHLLVPGFYFNKLLEYPVFYVIGIFVWVYFPMIRKWLRNKGILALLFMLIDAVIVIVIGNDVRVGLLTALLGSISMLYLAIRIDEGNSKVKSFLELSSQYSYGIYLMSPYVQVAIRVFLYQKLGMPYLFCMGLMLVLGFLVPYVMIKYVVERNVYFSRILLGKW